MDIPSLLERELLPQDILVIPQRMMMVFAVPLSLLELASDEADDEEEEEEEDAPKKPEGMLQVVCLIL